MITMEVTDDARWLCEENARKSILPRGGNGWGPRTLSRRSDDQVVAQLGHWAFAMWKDGNDAAYREHRERCNERPFHGDGGQDIVGLSVDVKSSLMRHSPHPKAYHLICRDPSPESVYVLALVPLNMDRVYLMGWETGQALLSIERKVDGALGGAFAIPAWQLQQLPPFRWA